MQTRAHEKSELGGGVRRFTAMLEALAPIVLVLVAAGLWWQWTAGGWFSVHMARAELARQVASTPHVPNSGSGSASHATDDQRSKYFSELGQTGDAFGGLNALMTAVAGALLAWAGYLQFRTLQRARKDAEEASFHREIEQYQALVFQLLELAQRVVDQVEGPPRKGKVRAIVPGGTNVHEALPRRQGFSGLDSYARGVFNAVPGGACQPGAQEQALLCVMKEFLRAYGVKPSMFGRYFRVQRELFAHIANPNVPRELQDRFASIARSQVSDGAVLLIAAYGLTPDGHDFVPLIERFGLLRFIHRRYMAHLRPALEIGYRAAAFNGGGDFEEALLPRDHFNALVVDTLAELDGEEDSSIGWHRANGMDNPNEHE